MTSSKVRSLPPLVDGDVFGNLTVTVDEVLWSKKYSGEIVALLQWWGDNDSVSLRPSDVTKYPESSKDNTSVTYDIQTNLTLFQTYLKQCSKLKVLLINNDTKEIVGHVVINNLNDLITGVQYQQYFPITTACGVRIGDLRVRFNLSMNSFADGTNKKMKKKSRKKNKTTHNYRTSAEEEKSKQIKMGCKTCSEHMKPSIITNPSSLQFPKPLDSYKVPPNTGRSDSSENGLLDVLERGKKLRDAMLLSVLEDADENLDDQLLLKLDEDKDTIALLSCKELLGPTKMDLASNEEKLINDYLNGKAMKEEEEVLVLNTLHGESNTNEESSKLNHLVAETKPHIPVQEGCCLSQASCAHYSARTTSNPTDSNLTTAIFPDIETNALTQKVNCFRVTVESLTLTSAGWKKINNAIENRYKCVAGEAVQHIGTTYFVECHFADDSPRSQSQPWKSTPLRFCSRRQIENVVYFGQSGAQGLRAPHGTARAEAALGSGRGVVCWRHLTRPLALLGQFTLAGVLRRGCVEASVSLPVTPEGPPGPPTAHLRLTVQLGRDKLYFGPALFQDPQSVPKENKAPSILKEEESKIPENEVHALSIEDLRPKSEYNKSKPKSCKRTEQSHSSVRDIKLTPKCKSVARSFANIEMPICANCSQNLTGTNCQNPGEDRLCVSCSSLLGPHKNVPVDPKFDISIPPDLAARDLRHHEFLIRIDTVIGFPLFSAVQEELSCYVDYKFPEVTSNLKVEMARRETTSLVVACEPQPSLASVSCHGLSLPVALPLSPLLAATAPGVTFRLWLRYYKPTPRDHMVALALLPMDELCLMELEFDRKHIQAPIVKVLDLPLALVPSSVTAPYHHYQGLGTLRVTVTYSNQICTPVSETIPSEPVPRNIHTLPSQPGEQARGPRPIEELLSRLTDPTEDDLRVARNRFWTGPFGKQSCNGKSQCAEEKIDIARSDHVLPQPSNGCIASAFQQNPYKEPSRPVLKQDFDNFAESLEQKFNKLQSELLKERQRVLAVDSIALNNIPPIATNDFMALASLSSNSSADNLPFVLGPPANFKDIQNTTLADNKAFSDSLSDKSQGTISGFLKEEKSFENCAPNKPHGEEKKFDLNKSQTFRATVKIDRAVNLKAVKVPNSGKKGKIPPSTWVSFGTGDCCEQNCGTGGFTTPVIRRNYNPIWNLAWDMDLPLEYLKQVKKQLVFRVFEENLDGVCFGAASANLSILTSGLPCLSSWLGINDLAGACKGQIKVVITPLEDLSKYQETLVFDADEDEFEELKEDTPEPEIESFQSAQSDKTTASFVASQSEVFVNNKEDEKLKTSDEHESDLEEEDGFSADDVISNYRSTLENNFRNEMAGLENLIRFLRVGSMGNGLPFMSSNENKENLSSNPIPTASQPSIETRSQPVPSPEVSVKCASTRSAQGVSRTINEQNEKRLIDASTETLKETHSNSSEDVLSRLLEQIVSIQAPVVKITDNTSQTVVPETRETCTETNDSCKTVQMRDASTETEDISESRPAQPHVCGELGSVLLQHFLTCRPGPVKVTDSICQTVAPYPPFTNPSTAQSSGMFLRSQPSGASEEMLLQKQDFPGDDIQSEAQSNCDRLTEIDNNLKDLERFLKENLLLIEHDTIPPIDSNEGSFSGSLNCVKNSIHGSELENSHSPSDLESLESFSQDTVFPREMPDGGSTEISSVNLNSADYQGTTLKRRGTFVIDKSKGDRLETRMNLE